MREVEQVVSPTAGLNINPGGSTGRKFPMDTREECIPEARFHMNPCRERKDPNRTTRADHEHRPRHDPLSHEGPCARKQTKKHLR